jgi:hypothetical protein
LPSPKESEYVWSDIWHLEAHHSTALEGNTLVLREVEVLLDKGRAVGAKPLREYMEVQGYGNAARWVYAHAIDPGDWRTDGLISMHEVRQVHSLAMSPVWQVAPHPDATDREGPGTFREHDIRMVPLPALVDKDLSLAALRQAAQRGRLDAVQSADGVWRSSRKAVEEYRSTRHRRRAT